MASPYSGPLLFAPVVAVLLLVTLAFTAIYWGNMMRATPDPQTAAGASHLADTSTPGALQNSVAAGAQPLAPSEEAQPTPGQPGPQPPPAQP